MAGLVDYGVDSDRESNDSPNHEISSLSRKQTEANTLPDDAYNRTKRSSCSNESRSSKSEHSKEVHKSSSSSSKNKSNDRYHKHHKRSRSRSRSKSRDRSKSHSKKRSRSRDRKDRHRDERKKKRRSKSRSKSRSRSRSRSRSSSLSRRERKSARRTRSQERREKKAATIARMGLDVTNVAASLVMPSGESKTSVYEMSSIKQNPHFTSTVVASSSSTMSAAVQAAAQKVLQSRVAEAQQVTGVALPSFYNPAAVNPMKYAQQIQKRKLLWANKEKTEPPTTAKLWEATAFTQDQDGKMTAKFKRLMGIKNDSSEGGAGPSQTVEDGQHESSVDVLKKQQELFASLDQQYQVARATTHTQRGLGLGFGSSNSSYPR